MSAAEKAADEAVRRTIIDGLQAADRLPVSPLLEIIIGYTLPFRCVVSTLSGKGGESGRANGKPDEVRYYEPINLCYYTNPQTGIRSLLISDGGSFRQWFEGDGRVAYFFGHITSGPGQSVLDTAGRFMSVCVDPSNPNRIYICDFDSVYLVDTERDMHVFALVGMACGGGRGYRDGDGKTARFSGLHDLISTRDGKTLILCDTYNEKLRSVDIATRSVSTVVGALTAPTQIVFDRATTFTPESIVFVSCEESIVRVDRQTGITQPLTIRRFESDTGLSPHGLVSLPSGYLLVTCWNTQSLYSIHTLSGNVKRLAGSGVVSAGGYRDGSGLSEAEFSLPAGLCLNESEGSVLVADANNKAVRRVTLPPHLFQLTK